MTLDAAVTGVHILTQFLCLPSFLLPAVNFLLKVFVKGLSMFEKHHSLTRMQESIVTKLFIGLFLNTGIVLLVVNMQFRHYTTRSVGFEVAFDGQYEDLVYDCE